MMSDFSQLSSFFLSAVFEKLMFTAVAPSRYGDSTSSCVSPELFTELVVLKAKVFSINEEKEQSLR